MRCLLRSWRQKCLNSNFHYPISILIKRQLCSQTLLLSSLSSSLCSHQFKYNLFNNNLSHPIICSVHLQEFHKSSNVLLNKAETLKQEKTSATNKENNNNNKDIKNNNYEEDRLTVKKQEILPKKGDSDELPKISSETYEEWKERDKREYKEKERIRKEKYRQKYMVNSAIITQEFFDKVKDKNKDTFLAAIDLFMGRDRYLRGHVEFIHAALKYMKQFGVHRDLEAYKKLLDVFPKGKMVAQTFWQVEFMHFPKQQFCALDVLEQMEDNGVMGDSDVEEMLANIFGRKSFPSRKHGRMMYWMPKFKNLSPFPLPDPLPWEAFELVKLAIKQMTTPDPQTQITIYNTKDLEDAVDHTWIVSGQSPDQQALIESHPSDRPIYVEGAFRIWLKDQCINYFILRAEPRPPPKVETDAEIDDVGVLHHIFGEDYSTNTNIVRAPSVHEQEDGVILAICATGTSSRDSLVSWIRFLQESNPRLGKDVSVLFTLKSPIGPTDNLDVLSQEQEDQKESIGEKDQDDGLIGLGLGLDAKNPDLSQVGVNPLSDTRFVNWPHNFNRQRLRLEEEKERKLSGAVNQDEEHLHKHIHANSNDKNNNNNNDDSNNRIS